MTTLEPVLVTVEAPNTAKLCAEPSDGAVWADAGEAPYKKRDQSDAGDKTQTFARHFVSFTEVQAVYVCRHLQVNSVESMLRTGTPFRLMSFWVDWTK